MAANIFGPRERKDPVQDVLFWLQQNDEQWLLVFDNAPVSGLARYLPDGDRGNILYTSRHRNLQPRLRPECVADVEEMDVQDSILLLLRSAQQSEYTDESRELAKGIVRALGFLPLAIDQAGAYIHMAPCSLDKYLGVFEEQKEALLRNPRFKGGDEQRHIAVYATFNISYKAIKAYALKKADMTRVKDAEVALKLLSLICFYNNEGDIHAIFDQAAKFRYETQRHLEFPLKAGEVRLDDLVWTFDTDVTPEDPDGRAWDPNDYIMGMGFLNEFSLIKFDSVTAYSNMHILVHDWARNRMGDEERSEWGLAARSILMDSITFKSGLHYVMYRRDVAPHVEVCQKHVRVEHHDPLLESEFQGKMALTFRQAGNLKAAESALAKALEYRKLAFGLLHDGTFAAMSQLANIYVDQGRYPEAEEMLREVLDRRGVHQREQTWEAVGKAQRTAAENNHKDEVAIPSSDDPLDNPGILKDTKALANVLVAQDQKAAAADLCLKIQQWYERTDENSPKVRRYKEFVSRLRSEIDESNIALTIHEAYQQVADAEARYGRLHPTTIGHIKTLARTMTRHDGHLEAEKLYQEVFEWRCRAYGEVTIQAFDARQDVARSISRQGRYYEADSIFAELMIQYSGILGPKHPTTLEVKVDLALCLYGKTLYDEAITLMEECLADRREVLGPQHTLTRQAEHCLRQIRETQATAPDYLNAGLRNKAMKTSLGVLGDRAPEWMRQWEPESEEALMRAHLERGTLRRIRLEVVREGDLVFTRIRPFDEVDQQQTVDNIGESSQERPLHLEH